METKSAINWKRLILELIVVFLGVTTGFVLNSWRSRQDEREMEKKYITSFKQDVQSDIEDLTGTIQEDSIWIAKAMPLIELIKEGEMPSDSSIVIMRMIV